MTPNTRGPLIDTHAHVFRSDLGLSPNRRYTPDYEALPENYLENLDRCGFERGVLVQPSFLGTDNSYLLSALASTPERLRGVVVLNPEIDHDLEGLAARGVRGIRINAIGTDVPDFTQRHWLRLGEQMAALGWHLEIQAKGTQWGLLLDALHRWPSEVVIDHLGLIPTGDDTTRSQVLCLARREHVWVKASGGHRNDQPRLILKTILDEVGVERLLFGTDWPFTMHETDVTMVSAIEWIREEVGEYVFNHTMPSNASRLLRWDQSV